MKHFQKIDILGKIKGKDRSFCNINVPCASRRSILYRYSLTRKKEEKKMIFMKLTKKIDTIRRDQRWAGRRKIERKKKRKEKKEEVRKKETKENRERRMKIKIDS